MIPAFSTLEKAMTRLSEDCTAANTIPITPVTPPSTSTTTASQTGGEPRTPRNRNSP